MRKLFLIPLMALMCSVMAWGATIKVGGEGADYSADLAGFNSAIAAATADDVILLQEDINYGNLTTSQRTSSVNIKKSVTIDGGNHTLTGSSFRPDGGYNNATIWINQSGNQMVDVTIRNLTIVNNRTSTTDGNSYRFKGIETRGKIGNLVLENVNIIAKSAALQIGGTHEGQAEMTNVDLTNCSLTTIWNPADENSGVSYYPVMLYNAINLTMSNCQTKGWAAIYFKPADSSIGSYGSNVIATDCRFDAQNNNTGSSNSFGAFVLEDDGINITLDNCYVNATSNTEQDQAIFCLSGWKAILQANMHLAPCEFTVRGASTEFLGNILTNSWKSTIAECPLTFFFYGGTYNDNIETKIAEGIPTGWHVNALPTVKGGEDIILYRVVKDAATHEVQDPSDPSQTIEVLYDLNDAVETTAEGENPATSFDLSTGTDMTLNNETTTAGYVQISDNVTTDPISGDPVVQPTTVTVGKTTGGDDQTLIISSGLDVQGESQVVVEPGATLQIGEGGVTTTSPENIVIEADENGAASLLLNPEVIVNNTPNLTVKMKAKSIGWKMPSSSEEYYWHRFALPIQQATTWVKNPNKSTYVFGWNYSTNDWEQLSALTQMVPFKGYTLTADYENLGDVEYTFTGQLAGNTNNLLEFERNGFNFFGNSYTGYIDILALVDQIMGDSKIDGTVWVWGDDQQYHAVPLMTLREGGDVYATEIAPMQTFILKQNGGVNATTELNYASAIWGNPRYGNSSPAPRRIVADETTRMRIIVTAENGKSDFVMFTEEGRFTDAFEKGYDGEKYMNENALNMYATVNDVDYSAVATDDLAGKTLTIQTVASVNYTMSFARVNGETYAIRDLMTNVVTPMTEGNTYTFAAQPNSTIEGRFVIVPMQNMPTDVETVETTPAVKGIYTIMGQYVGEDFDILPAGIYVVDGVKIVK